MTRKSNRRSRRKATMLIGLEGLDEKRLELGYSDKLWQLFEQRRKQRTMSSFELESQLEIAN